MKLLCCKEKSLHRGEVARCDEGHVSCDEGYVCCDEGHVHRDEVGRSNMHEL